MSAVQHVATWQASVELTVSHAPSPPPLTQRSGDILLPAVIALAAKPEHPPFWIWDPSVCVCPQRCGYNQVKTDIIQHLIGHRRRPIRAPQRRGVLDGGPADVCCIRSKVTDRYSPLPPPLSFLLLTTTATASSPFHTPRSCPHVFWCLFPHWKDLKCCGLDMHFRPRGGKSIP